MSDLFDSMSEEVLWQVLLIDTVTSSGGFWHSIPQPDARDGSISELGPPTPSSQ